MPQAVPTLNGFDLREENVPYNRKNVIEVEGAGSWNKAQGVSQPYEGARPDTGRYEYRKVGAVPDGWWAEGGEKVELKNGRLLIRSGGRGKGRSTCTVWNKTKFSGDLQISFDAQVVDCRCRKGTTYHVTITRKGRALIYDVDGTYSLTVEDARRLKEGLLGFRTWATDLWADNFRGRRVE